MNDERDLGLTLAGGGNRAFYQMGLLNRWHERIMPRVGAVGCCSAGACVIIIFLSGRQNESSAFWHKRREGVTRNFDWSKLLSGKRPTPQAPIYRDTMIFTLQDGGLERIRAQPFPIWILCATLPWFLGPLATPVGLSAYSFEKRIKKKMVHPSLGKRLGFKPFIYDARDCESPEALADLILASSATPPFTPVGRVHGKPLLDGGLIDNVPAFVPEQAERVRQNLVLLTRPYPDEVLGIRGNRLYIAPTKPVPAGRWDYTQPKLVDATRDMGEVEAAVHQPLLDRFLGVGCQR